MNLPLLPHLRGLTPVPHGGAAQLAGQGIDPRTVLDFSATVLPGELPPAVGAAMAHVVLPSYPDPHCAALRAALAAHHGLSPAQVLPANGSVALIQAVARACLAPGATALIVGPTFGEYAQAVRLCGGRAVTVCTEDVDAVVAQIHAHQPRLVFLCSPNNPTGCRWSNSALARIAEHAFVVLDEAYAGFLRPPPPPVPRPGRLILRSLTKERGLAGLRLGYAVADAAVIAALSELLTPWGVNALAQQAGIAVLECGAVFEARIDAMWAERARLIAALTAQGERIEAGQAPFFLLHTPSAAALTADLLAQGILVRDATSFGLPQRVRISPRTAAAGDRLLTALQRARRRHT